MNCNLYIFGDSNSLPFFGNPEEEEKYKKFKGGKLPKGWMELLSENLNCNLISFAKMGSSNSSIFQTICENIHKVKENDILIIGWTFRMRYQVVSKYDKDFYSFSNVVPSMLPENSLLSPNCMEELLVHKNLNFWVNEIYSWERLLILFAKKVGFKIFFWSFDEMIGKAYIENANVNYYIGKKDLDEYYESDYYKNFNIIHEKKPDLINDGFWKHLELLGMKQIWDETNGEVNDGHIDELGHKILSQLFLYEIEKNKYF